MIIIEFIDKTIKQYRNGIIDKKELWEVISFEAGNSDLIVERIIDLDQRVVSKGLDPITATVMLLDILITELNKIKEKLT